MQQLAALVHILKHEFSLVSSDSLQTFLCSVGDKTSISCHHCATHDTILLLKLLRRVACHRFELVVTCPIVNIRAGTLLLDRLQMRELLQRSILSELHRWVDIVDILRQKLLLLHARIWLQSLLGRVCRLELLLAKLACCVKGSHACW